MGKGRLLNEYEKGKIDALKGQNLSNRAIAREIERSEHSVRNYLKNKGILRKNKKTGPKKKLSKRDESHIIREASNKIITIGEIKNNLKLDVSRETVRKVLRDSTNIKYCKLKKKPRLEPRHKVARLKWAREHLSFGEKWKSVIWSDEKKFNLDGPDGWRSYWHDLRKEEMIFSKRHSGGGSLMVWGCFNYWGKSNLAFVSVHQNQYEYQEHLNNHLLPFIRQFGGQTPIFEQDGARCHTARSTIAWLADRNIEVMEWPACSPDLTPIENLWGILARMVYDNGRRKFNRKEDLEEAIKQSWNDIQVSTLQTLSMSLPNRIFDVTLAKGNQTRY